MPGFNIETPQEVLARLGQQRDQQIATNNPLLMQKAVFGQILDNVFGNPEVRKAQMVQTKVKDSLSGMPAGLGEVDSELYRLRSMRDALVEAGEIDKASQVNMQLLAIGNQKLEQDKLRAQTIHDVNAEARDATKFPFEMQKLGVDTTNAAISTEQNATEGDNWINPKTGEMTAVLRSDSAGVARAMAQGLVKANPISVQGSKDDVTGNTKPTETDLQKSIIASQKQLDLLSSVAGKFKPEYLTYQGQLANWGKGVLDKMGALPAAQRAGYQNYIAFRTQSVAGLNQYIHDLTGAQMSVPEAERLKKAVPDAENDGPEQYIAKMRETAKIAVSVLKRSSDALKSGLKVYGDDWEKIKMPPVSDAEIDNWLSTNFGIPPRAGGGQSSPLQSRIDQIINGK